MSLAEFPLADIERPPRQADKVLIRRLCDSGEPLQGEGLLALLEAHRQFIHSGGGGGRWELLLAANLPLNIYMGPEAQAGEQLVMRNKRIPKGGDLRGRELSWADFSGSLCEGADFSHAQLRGSVLTDALLAGADFTGADLRGCDFSGSDLRGASFRDADLSGADMEQTDCTGCDFRGARLDGSRWPGCTLTDHLR